jgi:hypothetical protein
MTARPSVGKVEKSKVEVSTHLVHVSFSSRNCRPWSKAPSTQSSAVIRVRMALVLRGYREHTTDPNMYTWGNMWEVDRKVDICVCVCVEGGVNGGG